MATRTAKRRGSRVIGRSRRVALTQTSLWGPEDRTQRSEPWTLDTRTRECGRRGVEQARAALEHPSGDACSDPPGA